MAGAFFKLATGRFAVSPYRTLWPPPHLPPSLLKQRLRKQT
jgi:hypothetical protein